MTDDTYVQVGTSGLFVYRVGLGTMQFGWSVDEDGAFDVLDAYVEAGGNFIDTADIYSSWAGEAGGPPNPGGVSEEIIGRWIAARGNRDDLVIATKVRGAMGERFTEGRDTIHQREGLSRQWIMRACDDSLRRLGVDHIDLYQAHWIDARVSIEETLGAFTDLVRAGKVRYIGCSNYSAWRLVESLWTAERHGYERYVSLQPEYHLLDPTRGDVERDLAAACTRFGIGMVPYSPLAGGLLTGKYRRGEPLPDSVRADANRRRWLPDPDAADGGSARRAASAARREQNFDVIETLVDVADRNGTSPASAAINWLRAKPWVAAPIIGANRPAQLRDTLSGLDTPLPAEDVARLDEASDFRRPRPSRED